MKSIIKKSIVVFIILFVVLFFIRLGMGYYKYPEGEPLYSESASNGGGYSFETSVRNIAKAQYKQSKTADAPSAQSVDQKYEQVANIGTQSKAYDDDLAKVKSLIKAQEALIQYEQTTGLKGSRWLQMAIGVNPSRFDNVIDELKQVGKLVTIRINKTDKTNEYKSLQAKKISLEKSRAALIALKQRDAKVSELVQLESRILELEEAIQALGVNLGDFDNEYEFVTVKLTLAEIKASAMRHISIIKRSYTAFVWALKKQFQVIASLTLMIIGALALAKLVEIATGLYGRFATPK